MIIFQFAKKTLDRTSLWDNLLKQDAYDLTIISTDPLVYKVKQREVLGELTISEDANIINLNDVHKEVLFVRKIVVDNDIPIVISHDQDETEILIINSLKKTPIDQLDSFSLNTESSERKFINSFDYIIDSLSDELDLPENEKMGRRINEFFSANPAIRPFHIWEAIHIVDFYAESSRINLLHPEKSTEKYLLFYEYDLDNEVIGLAGQDFDIIINRIEEYEDDTFGFFGEITKYADTYNHLRDEELIENERINLINTCKKLVSEIDYEIEIDDLDQSLDSMHFGEDHPGEWVTKISYNNGQIIEAREFSPRTYGEE